jgi:hypothetical protein
MGLYVALDRFLGGRSCPAAGASMPFRSPSATVLVASAAGSMTFAATCFGVEDRDVASGRHARGRRCAQPARLATGASARAGRRRGSGQREDHRGAPASHDGRQQLPLARSRCRSSRRPGPEITRITQLLLHEGTCGGHRLVPGDYMAG